MMKNNAELRGLDRQGTIVAYNRLLGHYEIEDSRTMITYTIDQGVSDIRGKFPKLGDLIRFSSIDEDSLVRFAIL